ESGSSAVVTFYDRQGRVATAFTASESAPLQPRAEPEPEPEPPPRPRREERRAGAQEEYDLRAVAAADGASTATGYLGRARWPLDAPGFYEAVNRTDLAAGYRRQEA